MIVQETDLIRCQFQLFQNYLTESCFRFRVTQFTPEYAPVYKRLELWKTASIAKAAVLSYLRRRSHAVITQDAELRWLEQKRKERSERITQFVHRAKMESLPLALASYKENLTVFVTLVRAAGAEPIFISQAIQRRFRTDEERKRLWMGAMEGGKAYVKQEQLAAFVDQFNGQMRNVAIEEEVAFFDLPDEVNDDWRLYYDGVHFNELGARVFARELTTFLQQEVLASDQNEGAPMSRRASTQDK